MHAFPQKQSTRRAHRPVRSTALARASLRLVSLALISVLLLAACGIVPPQRTAQPLSLSTLVPTLPALATAAVPTSGDAGEATATAPAAATAAATGAGGEGVPQTGQAQTFQVSITDNAFEPASLTIPAGSKVVWTHAGSNPHTVTSDDDSFTSQTLKGGDSFTRTYDQPGTFNYYCAIHGAAGGVGMAATIIVTAAAPTDAAATATAPPAATSTGAAAPTEAATAAATSEATAAVQPTVSGSGTFELFGAVNRDPAQPALSGALAAGSTTAGGPASLWVTWAENSPGSARQIFTSERAGESFQGRGASLNIHANVLGEFPTITFAGENRAVPWVAWAEPSPGFGNVVQIFASRFNSATGLWQPVGQDRGGGEPTINLHTNRKANHPFIFSGSGDPTKPPVPWVAWEEQSNGSNVVQIFVSKGVKVDDPAVLGGFRWEAVGKLDSFGEPTLNVDRSRESLHPTGVFAETSSTVPWVTWHETGGGRPSRVFTARGVADANTPGGFNWINVPPCTPDETACALNINPLRDAKDASMAAGSLTPGDAPVPWMAWAEIGPTGKWQVLVSRLDVSTRNSFLQVGGSLNVDQNHDARTPFIAFLGNVPYVAWLEDDGSGRFRVQVRHLASDAQTGTWALDTPESGFASDPSQPESELFAVGTAEGLFLSWTEGDPASGKSSVITGRLRP